MDRSKEYIGLNLSVVVWKALVGQEVQLSDLDNVDVLLTRSMHDIRTIDQKGEISFLLSDISYDGRMIGLDVYTNISYKSRSNVYGRIPVMMMIYR